MSSKAWTDTSPHPWRRYAARITDILVGGVVFWLVFGMVAYAVAPGAADVFFGLIDGPFGKLLDLMLTVMISVPICAAFVGATGLTLGKWIFGVRVSRGGEPIGFAAALRREASIWYRGLGLGVPIISLVTLAQSFRKLKDEGVAKWDEGESYTVTHRPTSIGWTAAMWLAIVGLIVLRVGLNTL